MTETETETTRMYNGRLRQAFGAFRSVLLTVLLLGVAAPLVLTAVNERRQAAQDAALARALFETDEIEASARLAGIVRRTELTHVWIVDGAGVIRDSNDPEEIGDTLDPALVEYIARLDSGSFSRAFVAGGRDETITGLKDIPAERTILLSKPHRSFTEAALPPLAGGLILSLVLCISIVLRACSLSSELHESADNLESTLRDALRGSTGTAPERVRNAAAGGMLESTGRLIADVLKRTHIAESSADAAATTVRSLFNAIPHPAYIRTPDGRISAVNRRLADELDRPVSDLVDVPEAEVRRVMPTDRVRMLLGRKGFRNRGIEGLIVSPASDRLTIMPVQMNGDQCHLVMLELNEKSIHAVERDSPETPRGLRMAVDIAEVENPLRETNEPLNLIASNEINSGLSDLYGATDLAVWAIDETGRTLHWSRSARRMTGVWKRDIPDIDAFCQVILVDDAQRHTLLRWLESDPTRLSRQLICRTRDNVPVGLTWNADETLVRTRPGEMKRVTVLWCKAPVLDDVEHRV
ncbi:MAG: hypothetical protein HKN17_01980 [Rhodothermales bacterium]|nr:hypothetical protein [Rhodothermales bacterium]